MPRALQREDDRRAALALGAVQRERHGQGIARPLRLQQRECGRGDLLDNGRHRLLVAALLACVLERAESAEDETLVSSRGDAKVLHVRLL